MDEIYHNAGPFVERDWTLVPYRPRPNDSARSWFGDISVGWAFPQSDADDILDDDWTLGGGVLFWPSDWPVGIQGEVSWVKFDLSSETINAINDAVQQDPLNSGQVDDGDVESWQFLLNAIWSPGNNENGFDIVGGVGAYYLDATVTKASPAHVRTRSRRFKHLRV